MFFDCSALLLGLAASLVAKWKPNDKFTYGFGRAEILAGLANGLFLLFIALFIMKEAIERTFEPPEVHHERLFTISVLGFFVNIVGIFVFQHGGQGHHHHGSGGCSHSHATVTHAKQKPAKNSHALHTDYKYDNRHGYSHYSNPTVVEDNHDHHLHQQSAGSVALDMNGYSPSQAIQSTDTSTAYPSNLHDNHHHHDHHEHEHEHSHEHSDIDPFIVDKTSHSHSHTGAGGHRGQIMQSVFLHIVADTLGSVGVMISALLMQQFGWMIADPLCSLFIAILIAISVYPLLRDSIFILMQRVPVDIEDKLAECLFKIQSLDGVLNVHETHFWTLNSDTYISCLKLEVAPTANYRLTQEQTKRLLNQIGVNRAHIEIDYAQ